MTRRATAAVLALSLALHLACANDSELAGRGGAGPVLIPLDSIRLVEADSMYIGNPFTPLIDRFDGTIYIPDIFSNRVMRFGRDGSLVRVYGRPGSGPGEFRAAGLAAIINDSTIVVHDMLVWHLSLFDRNTGEFRRRRHFGNSAGITPPVVREDEVWLAAASYEREGIKNLVPFSLGRWDLNADSIEYLGAMPAEFMQSIRGGYWEYAAQIMNGALTFHERGILRGWQVNNELFLMSAEGDVLDTVNIPIVRRKGSPKNVREVLDIKRIGERQRIEGISRLRQLHTLSDGSIAFTHHDQKILKSMPMPVLSARVWVGVLSPDLKRACVDAELPVSQDARSMETFRGDTLFQLDRRMVGDRLETWIRLFLIDPSGCDWISTREGL